MKIDHLKFQSLDCQKIEIKSKSSTSSLLVGLFAAAIANLFIASSEPSSRAITQSLQKYLRLRQTSLNMVSIFTLVSIGINHPFARCLRLPMKKFNMRKFEGNICSLTSCLFVHSFNKHWSSSSWLYLTKEIVSNFRRSHSPAHSKKSPSYSILEGASAVRVVLG